MPNPNVMCWLAEMSIENTWLSAVTICEIQKGVHILEEGSPLRQRLSNWLTRVRQEYSNRILPFDEETALMCGRLLGDAQREGRLRPIADSQIAATALRHGMVLVTRNVRDMEGFGVKIVNPFEA